MKRSSFYVVIGLAMLVSTSFFALPTESEGLIGVDYGLYMNLLSPSQAVALLHSKCITRVRRYEARPEVTLAFANAGIDLMLGVPNKDVAKLSSSSEAADNWVLKNVVPFPTANISAIIVGNEWFYSPSNNPSLLLPAMQNIHKALHSHSQSNDSFLDDIKVSTSHAFNVISSYFPPSTAKFTESVTPVMAPILSFLDTTESFFMVDIFPYLLVAANPQVKDLLQFALFNSTQVVQDPYTHLDYTNLFDLQLDAVYAAIGSLLSSTLATKNSSTCGCIANHTNSDKGIYQTAATQKGHIPQTKVNSGMSSGSGSARSSPRSGLASTTTSVHDTSMPIRPKREEVDQTLSATKLSGHGSYDETRALPRAQLTSSEISLSSSLFDYNEIKASQQELKPFANSSLLPGLGRFSKESPQVSTLRSAPKSSSSSKSRPSSITKSVPSSRTSTLKSAHKEADYNHLLGQGYSWSSATSYLDVCTLRGALQVATVKNAQTYNQNLIDHVLEASGTPANPTTPINAYIFELFDEAIRGQHYGLFYPDGTPVYPISFVE